MKKYKEIGLQTTVKEISDIGHRIYANLPITGAEYLRPLFQKEWTYLEKRWIEERERKFNGYLTAEEKLTLGDLKFPQYALGLKSCKTIGEVVSILQEIEEEAYNRGFNDGETANCELNSTAKKIFKDFERIKNGKWAVDSQYEKIREKWLGK